ncbi:MAG: type II toxin-antitoxin system HicB family antitoxin [Chloroflexi bacterium]|nr:type II toxin-antitoxin system HicB family antitoxin [Chloroflexota bacterium]
MAREAIALHIEGPIAEGEPVPEGKERPQVITIRVAA